MTLGLFQNMGIVEWLILFALLVLIFHRSIARPLGRVVGAATANEPKRPAASKSANEPSQSPPSANPHARYFRALELPESATREQIREAYRELVKVWHPDRFAHDEKLKERATAKLKEINEAYAKLMG